MDASWNLTRVIEEIIESGNIELIKLAMKKGLLLESKDPL